VILLVGHLEVAGLLLIPERLKDKSEESELARIFIEGRGGLILAFLTGRTGSENRQ
jgi:hypothetical protein